MSNPIIDLIESSADSMTKNEYDSNNDGIVDQSSNSSKLNGKGSSEFANINGDSGVDFKVPLNPAGNDSAASKKYVDDNAGSGGSIPNDTSITISAGNKMNGGGTFTLDQALAENITLSHDTGSGSNHIPSGGSSGDVLKWSSDGTGMWGAESGGGSGEMNVQSDWNEVDNTNDSFIKNKPSIPSVGNGTISFNAGSSLNGGGSFSANQSGSSIININHDIGSGNNHIPSGGSSGQILKWSSNGTAVWGAESVSGSGDMLKSTYDTNDNGIVDNSERLGSQLPNYYAIASDLNNYLPLTGGSLTGTVTLDSSSINPTKIIGRSSYSDNLSYSDDYSKNIKNIVKSGSDSGPGLGISSGNSSTSSSSLIAYGIGNIAKYAVSFDHNLNYINIDSSMKLNHPGTCKGFIMGTPTGTIRTSYNVNSITEIVSGSDYTYELDLNFSIQVESNDPTLSGWAVGYNSSQTDVLTGMILGTSSPDGPTNTITIAFNSISGHFREKVDVMNVGFFSHNNI